MSKYLKMTCVLTIATAICASLALAQDPVKVAPTVYKVLVENERVRVLEATVKPGETVPFHSHPAYSAYFLAGGTARFFSSPTDTGVVVELKTGVANWSDGETHSAKNIGATTIRLLITELREPKPAPAPAPSK